MTKSKTDCMSEEILMALDLYFMEMEYKKEHFLEV